MDDDKSPLLIICLLLVLVIGKAVFPVEAAPKSSQESGISFQELFYSSSVPYYPELYKDKIILYDIEIDRLLYRIIECESNFNPDACNGENCYKGRGLGQLVSGTEKHCEEKLGRVIDPFNPIDNLECVKWLYENEGTDHWGTQDTDWGSYKCFKDYLYE